MLQSLAEWISEGEVMHVWAQLPGDILAPFDIIPNSGRSGMVQETRTQTNG